MSPPLNTRARVLLPAFLLVLLLLGYLRVWRSQPEGPWRLSGSTMGTTYQVVVAPPHPGEQADLARAVQRELDEVERLMSTYRPDSEVMRFNASGPGEPFALSAETAQVVAAAQGVARETRGAFDITVRPLVALWGFGSGARVTEPQPEELTSARKKVGHQQIQLAPQGLTKSQAGVEIDLSAIAKGHGVDEVIRAATDLGYRNVLVEVGGEVAVRGEREAGKSWRVGVEVPEETGRRAGAVVRLSAGALATSGDYRNYYEKNGVRLSHTVDPRTGRPIRHALASVSVVHESAMLADAYATALNVMGPEDGMEFALAQGLPAYFIVRVAPEKFEARSTPAFDKLLVKRQ